MKIVGRRRLFKKLLNYLIGLLYETDEFFFFRNTFQQEFIIFWN